MTIGPNQMADPKGISTRPHRVPDVQLKRALGGTVSPADFLGHELIVLFLPSDASVAAKEMLDYAGRIAELGKVDAWLLAVCDEKEVRSINGLAVVHDVEGAAWDAMIQCVGAPVILSRDQGAAFIFTRGGSIQKVFSGPGHAAEVVEELGKRR